MHTNNSAQSLYAINIAEAAHHLDLMWSDANDTDAVRAARDFELQQMRLWIDAKKKAKSQLLMEPVNTAKDVRNATGARGGGGGGGTLRHADTGRR